MITAVTKLKNGKAVGADEIPNEIFTKANLSNLETFRSILQDIASKKTIPNQWQKGQIIRLYKGKRKMLKSKRDNTYKQLWKSIRENTQQPGHRRNRNERKPSRRPKWQDNNRPPTDPK